MLRSLIVIATLITPLLGFSQATEARAAFETKDWAKAKTLYRQVVEADPKDGAAWYQLGSAALSAKDPATAIDAFQHSFSLGFAPGVSSYNLACAYARAGDSEKALATLETVAKRFPILAKQAGTDTDLVPLAGSARFAAIIQSAEDATEPCRNDPLSRQFDFWVGDWDVLNKQGQRAGTSHVERSMDGCVIIENWHGTLGDSGMSLNTYNPGQKQWQQFWVSNSGAVTTFDQGELQGGAMRFLGTENLRQNDPRRVRLTFFPLPNGSVRQLGEGTSDGGKTWNVRYDLQYVAVSKAAATGK
jgi:tetratricopeptide (TPR) repeat protein